MNAPVRGWNPPSAEAALAEVDGAIYRPSTPAPVASGELGGYGGGMGLELRYRVGTNGDLVETRSSPKQQSSDVMDVHFLVADELETGQYRNEAGRLDFPLHLDVERSNHRVPIDGHAVDFEVTSCGQSALVQAPVHGHWLTVKCPVPLIPQLALTTIGPAELASLIQASRERHGI